MALASNALTTVATVATDLDLTVDATITAQLERMINAASDRIAKFCNRIFGQVIDEEESVMGYGRAVIVMSRAPIIQVTAVTYNSSAVDITEIESTDEDDAAGLVRRIGGWPNTAMAEPGYGQYRIVAGSQRPTIGVTYDAGWSLPQDSRSPVPGLPYDIEEACLKLTKFLWFGRNRDSSVKSLGTLTSKVTFGNDSDNDGIPDDVASMLRPYVLHAVG